jgi:hypothetical protein
MFISAVKMQEMFSSKKSYLNLTRIVTIPEDQTFKNTKDFQLLNCFQLITIMYNPHCKILIFRC